MGCTIAGSTRSPLQARCRPPGSGQRLPKPDRACPPGLDSLIQRPRTASSRGGPKPSSGGRSLARVGDGRSDWHGAHGDRVLLQPVPLGHRSKRHTLHRTDPRLIVPRATHGFGEIGHAFWGPRCGRCRPLFSCQGVAGPVFSSSWARTGIGRCRCSGDRHGQAFRPGPVTAANATDVAIKGDRTNMSLLNLNPSERIRTFAGVLGLGLVLATPAAAAGTANSPRRPRLGSAID